MKTKEELNKDELKEVSGGLINFAERFGISCPFCKQIIPESQMYDHFKNEHNLSDEEMPLGYLSHEMERELQNKHGWF